MGDKLAAVVHEPNVPIDGCLTLPGYTYVYVDWTRLIEHRWHSR